MCTPGLRKCHPYILLAYHFCSCLPRPVFDGNKKTPIPMARDERSQLAVPPLLPPQPCADDHSCTPLPLDLQERMAVLITGNNPDPAYWELYSHRSAGRSGRIFGGIRRDAFTFSSLAGARGAPPTRFHHRGHFMIDKSIKQLSKKSILV